jgi:hypothetical protein
MAFRALNLQRHVAAAGVDAAGKLIMEIVVRAALRFAVGHAAKQPDLFSKVVVDAGHKRVPDILHRSGGYEIAGAGRGSRGIGSRPESLDFRRHRIELAGRDDVARQRSA